MYQPPHSRIKDCWLSKRKVYRSIIMIFILIWLSSGDIRTIIMLPDNNIDNDDCNPDGYLYRKIWHDMVIIQRIFVIRKVLRLCSSITIIIIFIWLPIQLLLIFLCSPLPIHSCFFFSIFFTFLFTTICRE